MNKEEIRKKKTEYQRKWVSKNKNKWKEYHAKWVKENRDKCRLQCKEWYKNNKKYFYNYQKNVKKPRRLARQKKLDDMFWKAHEKRMKLIN